LEKLPEITMFIAGFEKMTHPYGDEYTGLQFLKNEVQSAGEENKPVFLEEVYYNDPEAHRQVMQAWSDLHLNIRFIMQWPVLWGAIKNNFSVLYPADYSAYLP
jgi:hypothetical protein